jgi:ribosomal protein S18 acetylase RimI-like enzyme
MISSDDWPAQGRRDIDARAATRNGQGDLNPSAKRPPNMNPSRVTLRPAALADISAMMAIERSPDYELYVARSDEEEHCAMLTSPSHAYRVGVGQSGEVEAFAILRGLGDPHANLYLKRVAVARPGRGVGTAFLGLVLDEAFGPMGAERFHLDCFADNMRAQRSYEKLGFTRDGVLRQAYRLADGRRVDLVMMAVLKSEWEARLLAAAQANESETSLFNGLQRD